MIKTDVRSNVFIINVNIPGSLTLFLKSIYMCMYVCKYMHVCTFLYECMCVYVCMYVCAFVCICVCM